ncbi:MAG: DUF3955 domain-containing protein [Pseudomonadota bacterium]
MGLACIVAFQMIGRTIDSEGFLQEPFFLLPIDWAGIVTGRHGLLVLTIGRFCRSSANAG